MKGALRARPQRLDKLVDHHVSRIHRVLVEISAGRLTPARAFTALVPIVHDPRVARELVDDWRRVLEQLRKPAP
jgi:hypothetical protein